MSKRVRIYYWIVQPSKLSLLYLQIFYRNEFHAHTTAHTTGDVATPTPHTTAHSTEDVATPLALVVSITDMYTGVATRLRRLLAA